MRHPPPPLYSRKPAAADARRIAARVCRDYLAAKLPVAAAKLCGLVGLSEGMPRDAMFARQAERWVVVE